MNTTLLSGLLGYAAGLIPSADLAARAVLGPGGDLRRRGSGNPGAANARAELGTGWGLAVLAGDLAKGVLAARLGGRLAGSTGANAAGAAAVIGHCYPLIRHVQGGKGVATSIGQLLVTAPALVPVNATAAACSSRLAPGSGPARVAALAGSASWLVAAETWRRRGWPTGSSWPADVPLVAGAAVSAGVMVVRFLTAPPSTG